MMTEKRPTNPIIVNVLAIAVNAIGLEKQDEDFNDNIEFVSGMLK
jgi:hypothetical protein